MTVLGEEGVVVSIPCPHTALRARRCLVDAENIHIAHTTTCATPSSDWTVAPRCGSDQVVHWRVQARGSDTFCWLRSMGTFALSALRAAISTSIGRPPVVILSKASISALPWRALSTEVVELVSQFSEAPAQRQLLWQSLLDGSEDAYCRT